MTDAFGEATDPFLSSARFALRSVGGEEALRTLEWTDLLPHLDDVEARRAVFMLFRAQGHELVTSPALGALMAHPYSASGWDGTVMATIQRLSPRRGKRSVVLGAPHEGRLLLDYPGEGVRLVEVSAAEFRPVDLPGNVDLHEVEVDPSAFAVVIPEKEASVLRRRSLSLGRTALACDMLGAAEATLELAVAYANDRVQFGQPIGRFQAVRHLLAWARVDCVGISSVTEAMVELDALLPPRYDEIVKAVAGRNGRRACQRTLQVLGGIGFTAEHPHHRFYSRILGLDALLGSSAVLTHALASDWRTSAGDLPQLTTAVFTRAG